MEEKQKTKAVGRPKGSVSSTTLQSQRMREELVKRVRKELKPILRAQIDAAKGLAIEKQIKIGNKIVPRYYIEKPDIAAGKYLVEQSIGRPKEQIEHSGEIRTFAQIVTELDKN